MNKISFKLSICIPTFNRADQLDKTLSRVVESIKVLGNDSLTEVLIGDNASEDRTRDVGSLYSQKYPNFKYIRNPSNLGTEKNWLNLISKASGDYVWILSDDDDFNVQIVSEIIRIANDFHPALIFLNYREATDGKFYNSRCMVTDDVCGAGWKEFLEVNKLANSFVSSNVFDRRVFNENLATFMEFMGSPWFQLYVSRYLLGDTNKFYIASISLLEMHGLSLMESRREQYLRGRRHFYFDAHIAFVEFLYDLNLQKDSYLSWLARCNLYQQILYEKHTWKNLSGEQDYRYWIKAIRKLFGIDLYSKTYMFYLRDVPLMLVPGLVSSNILRLQEVRRGIGIWIRAGELSSSKFRSLVFNIYHLIRN